MVRLVEDSAQTLVSSDLQLCDLVVRPPFLVPGYDEVKAVRSTDDAGRRNPHHQKPCAAPAFVAQAQNATARPSIPLG
jgi:hypothetical protein